MKTVKIYIETSFRTPVSKQGKYAAALVFTKGGQDFTRTVSGEVQNRELWKLFLDEAEKHEIEMRLKGDEYIETLQAAMDGEEVEA